MFIIATLTYPPDKAVQIAKKFIKAMKNPLPSFIKLLYVLTSSGGELGIKVLGIYEVDDAKLTESIKEIGKSFVQYYYDVEGFRYTLEPMLPAAEAILLLGI
jgi:hypothetical protein